MDNFKKTNHSPNDPCETVLMKANFVIQLHHPSQSYAELPKLRQKHRPLDQEPSWNM